MNEPSRGSGPSSRPLRWPIAEEYYTVPEVAKLLRVARMTVYRLVDRDELASIRVGRGIRIPRSAVVRFLNAGGNHPDATAGWKNFSQR